MDTKLGEQGSGVVKELREESNMIKTHYFSTLKELIKIREILNKHPNVAHQVLRKTRRNHIPPTRKTSNQGGH